MGKCVIFCAAGFDGLLAPIAQEDYVLAADGGLRHLQSLGLTPDGILGDFDSLGYVPAGASVFPVEKDDTDLMLAIRLGLQRGCREFWIYGGLDGPRLDHTVANYQALSYLCQHDAFGYLIGRRQIATCLRNGRLRFPASAAGLVSVFCLGEKARGVTLTGVHYPLTEGELSPHFPLGVSNAFTGQEATVAVGEGTLLCIWERSSGICRRE